jgi:methyl-accepting chemotaxis protein
LPVTPGRRKRAPRFANAVEKWTRDTEQFASIAAGGIKWNKADVVRDAYALYRDDASLNMVQFYAFNRDNEAVDSWTRDNAEESMSDAAIKALVEEYRRYWMTPAQYAEGGLATIVVPLPKNAAGQHSGEVVTVWTTAPIYAAAQWNAVMLFAIQAVMMAGAFASAAAGHAPAYRHGRCTK